MSQSEKEFILCVKDCWGGAVMMPRQMVSTPLRMAACVGTALMTYHQKLLYYVWLPLHEWGCLEVTVEVSITTRQGVKTKTKVHGFVAMLNGMWSKKTKRHNHKSMKITLHSPLVPTYETNILFASQLQKGHRNWQLILPEKLSSFFNLVLFKF